MNTGTRIETKVFCIRKDKHRLESRDYILKGNRVR